MAKNIHAIKALCSGKKYVNHIDDLHEVKNINIVSQNGQRAVQDCDFRNHVVKHSEEKRKSKNKIKYQHISIQFDLMI